MKSIFLEEMSATENKYRLCWWVLSDLEWAKKSRQKVSSIKLMAVMPGGLVTELEEVLIHPDRLDADKLERLKEVIRDENDELAAEVERLTAANQGVLKTYVQKLEK